MLFERYVVRVQENQNHTNIFEINFEDEHFENVIIENVNYNFSTRHHHFEFDNASFENLIVIFTKSELVYQTIDHRELYRCKIAYVKTSEDQVIVNTQDWNVVNHLNEYQGTIDFLDVFILPYDNMAKIAVQYKYHSISQNVLYQIVKQIMVYGFIGFGIDFDEDLEIVKDYFLTDFEDTFNQSRKNKKIIFYMDTINNGVEIINSAKIEYSVKADVSFENTFNYLRANTTDNIVRYSIKCEDEDMKTASIDGYNQDLRTNEWEKAARINIDVSEPSININQSMSHFLRGQ